MKLCLSALRTSLRNCQPYTPKNRGPLRWGACESTPHTTLGHPQSLSPSGQHRPHLPAQERSKTPHPLLPRVPLWTFLQNRGSIYNLHLFTVAETRDNLGEDVAKLPSAILCR